MKRQSHNSGMAVVESLPILVVFVILMTYALGFFGVVHTAILNSIAARNYAFETFRHRNNVVYFRHQTDNPDSASHYQTLGFRMHVIKGFDASGDETFLPTQRKISFRDIARPDEVNRSNSNDGISKEIHDFPGTGRYRGEGANPVWITIGYGLCINAKCGE